MRFIGEIYMIKISASIVIYNENKKILERVIKNFLDLEFEKELIIVDNSPINVLGEFCEQFDSVKYIFSGKNLGFGVGHNEAFVNLSLDSDIHMIINPDTYFDSKSIGNFLKWFYSEKNVSLSVPQVLNIDGSVQNIVRNIPTPLSLIKRKLNISHDEIDIKNNSIVDIPFAHGCFLVFQTDVFKKINGFDERFFMYMEDIDIFIKAKKYGRTMINTNYSIYHEHRKASSKNLKLLWIHILSAIKFFKKYNKFS